MTTPVQAVAVALAYHWQVEIGKGECGCGHVVPLGHMFSGHLARVAVEAARDESEHCTTPDCPGDGRYAAPGRGHAEGCHYPRDRLQRIVTDVEQLREAATAERREWEGKDNARLYPHASRIHLALADWLDEEAARVETAIEDGTDARLYEPAARLAEVILGGGV